MARGRIVRPPWKRNLAGLRELANWAGLGRAAIDAAIKSNPKFPEPEDFLGMGRVWKFRIAVKALEAMGYSEGGGGKGKHPKEEGTDHDDE